MGGPVFTVLGAGMQGTCAAYDLLRAGASEVRLADVDGAAAKRSAERVQRLAGKGRAVGLEADARRPETLASALDGAAVVVSCVPYFLNPPVAVACVAAGVGYCDLGGNTEVSGRVLALDSAAKERGVTLVPDCGLAPGLSNTLAAALFDRIPGLYEVRAWCGGLPQSPEPPFDYHLVFSIDGLLNEYAGVAEVLRDGQPTVVPALDEVTPIEFPGLGRLEGFMTSGGTSSAPRTFAGRLRTFEYKTLRYPGHIAMFRAYRELGLFSEEPLDVRGGARVRPRDVFATLLRPRIEKPGARDLVALMVEGRGKRDGREISGRFVLLDRYDPETGFSAMERSTAYPAAVVAWMIAAGETQKGAVPLESGVPAELFLAHLAKRDLPLTWEITA